MSRRRFIARWLLLFCGAYNYGLDVGEGLMLFVHFNPRSAMKRLVGFNVILVLFAMHGFPQAENAPAKDRNLYSTALFASIAEMENSWGGIEDGNAGSRRRTDYHHLVVVNDSETTYQLPAAMGDYHVEYLDKEALVARYKLTREEFSVLEIHPMRNDGPRLTIEVSVSWVSYEKGRMRLGLSDWSDVEFRYDCEKQAFVISSVKLGGI